MNELCPCGLNKAYELCCGPLIDGGKWASTPTELMRSRYTAYVRHNSSYITLTMKGPAAQHFKESGSVDSNALQWERLNVLREKMKTNTHAYVTFEAYYRINGVERVLCEKSEFKKIDNRWYYVDGKYLKPQ